MSLLLSNATKLTLLRRPPRPWSDGWRPPGLLPDPAGGGGGGGVGVPALRTVAERPVAEAGEDAGACCTKLNTFLEFLHAFAYCILFVRFVKVKRLTHFVYTIPLSSCIFEFKKR